MIPEPRLERTDVGKYLLFRSLPNGKACLIGLVEAMVWSERTARKLWCQIEVELKYSVSQLDVTL